MCLGIFLELSGVGQRRGVNLDLRGRGPRLDHFYQDAFLLRRIAFDGFHQVGNQIAAALILVLNLGPLGLGPLFLGGDIVDTTANEQRRDKQDHSEAGNR